MILLRPVFIIAIVAVAMIGIMGIGYMDSANAEMIRGDNIPTGKPYGCLSFDIDTPKKQNEITITFSAYTRSSDISAVIQIDGQQQDEFVKNQQQNQIHKYFKVSEKNSHELHSLHEGLEIEEQSVVLIVEEKQPVSELHLFYVNEEGNETLVDAFYNYSKQPEIFVDSLPATIDSREKEIIIGWNSTNMEDQSRLLYQLEYSWGYDIWVPVGIPTKNTSISEFELLYVNKKFLIALPLIFRNP